MPAARRAVDPCFQEQNNGQYVCSTCATYLGPKLMNRKTALDTHLLSQAHIQSVKLEERARQAREQLHATEAAYEADWSQAQLHDWRDISEPAHNPKKNLDQDAANFLDQIQDDDVTIAIGFSKQDDAGEALARESEEFRLATMMRLARSLGIGADPEEVPVLAFRDQDEGDSFLTNVMQNLDLDDDPDCDDIHAREFGFENTAASKTTDDWFPYPNKTFFLLDTLDNLPRLRISDSLMRMILWVLRESGAKSVPSFSALRKFQDNLRKTCGIKTHKFESPYGNIYYANDIPAIIAKDYANPLTAPLITKYPHETQTVSEVWHGEKLLKDVPLDQLCPHYIDPTGSFYYVNEFARLVNGEFVIPKRWKTRDDGQLWADAYAVHEICDGPLTVFTVDDQEMIVIKAADLNSNLLDLAENNMIPHCDALSEHHTNAMPNPLRTVAEGEPLYSSYVTAEADDVSANKSKSWNKHDNVYFTHGNLPRRLLQQEFHVHFVSTSPHATAVEQFWGFKKMIEQTQTHPVRVHDVTTGGFCRFRLFVHDVDSDNPMASDECGHIGSGGNCNCRRCKRGGPQSLMITSDGYESLFKPQEPRTGTETLEEIKTQVKLACSGIESKVAARQTETGVKDKYTQKWIDELIARARKLKLEDPSRTDENITDELMIWVIEKGDELYNPFLQMAGFDPNRDTPVEVLHTMLLGIVRYSWHGTHTSLSPEQLAIFCIRLQSSSVDGLSIPPIRSKYLVQYRNSLVGKQFKQILQTIVFHLHELTDELHFSLWKAVGSLCALLWFPEIRNMEEYLADLQISVENVIDIFSLIDPNKIWQKIKLHLLDHIVEDVRRFGPIIGRSTELFECFNAIFRFCAILCNKLSPSHDIAIQLADQEALKQRITGGLWEQSGEWVAASPKVTGFLQKHRILQNHLGWTVTSPAIPGTAKLVAERRREELKWGETLASRALNTPDYSTASLWLPCTKVIAIAEDTCKIGSWVFARSPFDVLGACIIGQITEILKDKVSPTIHIVLDRFEIGNTLHPRYDMPVLVRRHDEATSVVIDSKSIHFIVNVQHDCVQAGCEASGSRPQKQEREDSNTEETFIQHKPEGRYILNMHALHNAHLIRSILPRHLCAPKRYLENRRETHDEISLGLREVFDGKQQKRAEAAAEKKKEKDAEKERKKQERKAANEQKKRERAAEKEEQQAQRVAQGESSRKRRRE